ncbi:MAG: excinuclease ABC subunit B [Candidatus Magasanikbacteria bacterium RIFCSPHIGHO2_02_FULL_51_14]|uniref:UvrABC system protein B n=1 Tax=Candidatus Magasanikbacteria bacterium RIFCSPHIGHO2_02_FULL_51_14 TaxID=1798683 RepID=A0A1F6MDB5_9BACT|nr:MAG: excinuclease ABC subunit B [Candidatus Magasanikbacteria bacterium RIFCSPHIGHO2_02_FULL_51_14]
MPFKLKSPYKPAGDQPKAIDGLVSGLQKGHRKQTLLGVTGSGKTFTMANVIERVQMPTLVIAHNKTLAAQLCNEFRQFFPENAVEFFVSYYDYYQPEAYMPVSDTYIEKETQVNEEIDRLRHACTQALLSRRDVIIVASVSCIYGLGSPTEYEKIVLHLEKGQALDRRGMLAQLVEMQFARTNADLTRGTFRMRGQVFEIMPVNEEMIWRLEISNKIDRIEKIHPATRKILFESNDVWLFPAKHYVAGPDARGRAIKTIREELKERLAYFEKHGKVLEHERLKRRVNYDLEMIKNLGYCNGIENYSRHFDGRVEGEPPFTLLDYFVSSSRGESSSSRGGASPTRDLSKENARDTSSYVSKAKDVGQRDPSAAFGGLGMNYLTIIDESHVTVPQIRGMFHGDRARKETLVEHGFRLPSAKDNRPLTFDEFEARVGQTVYVSATPSEYEIKESQRVVEQVVRPTGLVDPEVIVQPITPKGVANVSSRRMRGKLTFATPYDAKSQVEDVIERIKERIQMGERTLVTTLTKKMAEDLSEHLAEQGIKVKYLHSDIKTLERIEIITALRKGEIDVIVGVNLLREGLDMPEVSLVAILDADKEGFLRSETSLIQTIGRAARNVNGQVVLYADQITGSIERAISETQRRREIQLAYNKKHGITPKTIEKNIRNILEEFGIDVRNTKDTNIRTTNKKRKMLELDLMGDGRKVSEIIKDKEKKMKEAAGNLEFELAAILRDEVRELKRKS